MKKVNWRSFKDTRIVFYYLTSKLAHRELFKNTNYPEGVQVIDDYILSDKMLKLIEEGLITPILIIDIKSIKTLYYKDDYCDA